MGTDHFSQTIQPLLDANYAQLVLRALDHTAGVIIIDASNNILSFNNKFIEISTNSSHQDGENQTNSGQFSKTLMDHIKSLSVQNCIWHGEISYNKSPDNISWVDITIVPKVDDEKNITHYISICFDITLRKIAEEHLRTNRMMLQKALRIDSLTGIANRKAFSHHMRTLFTQKKNIPLTCISIIDIDSFKLANDTFGHKAGDKLLKEIAKKLLLLQNEKTFSARIGGDEFAVITTGETETDFYKQISDTLQALNFLFSFNGRTHHTTASIGYIISKPSENNIHDVLSFADIALYRAKSMGGNCTYAYTPELRENHDTKIRLRSIFLNSLQKNIFHIKYKPIIDIRSGMIIAANSIIQCSSPENNVTTYEDLQQISEDIDISRELYHISFPKIIQDIENTNIRSGLKLTNKNIIHTKIISNIISDIHKNNLNPRSIFIEFDNTHALSLANNRKLRDEITKLHDIGIQIVLSGFGKEQTSLMSLRDIAYDHIKIDASLIQSLTPSSVEYAIIKSIIDITHAMNRTVIAEGVKTAQCAHILQQLGCDFAQGPFYLPPLTQSQLIEALHTHNPTSP